jgi:hypothetical protein
MNYVVLYSGWHAPAFVNNNTQAKRYFFDSVLPNVKQEITNYLKKVDLFLVRIFIKT